jgi:hypothetical protein
MTPVNLLLAALVCTMAVAMTLVPPATAATFAVCAYVAGRTLIRRMP